MMTSTSQHHKGGTAIEAARKLDPPRTVESSAYTAPKPSVAENKPESTPRDIRIGKMIFYLTVALAIWFFYWFNGIQCPC